MNKEDIKMVECIWSDGTITLNAKYLVIKENQETYLIKNDLEKEKEYYKDMFKPVEPQKQSKEYEHKEVIKIIKDGETYKNIYNEYIVQEISQKKGKIHYKLKAHEKEVVGVDGLFRKVEELKLATTAEAFKELDERKIIESCKGYRYKKENNKIICVNEVFGHENIDFEELGGQWKIIEGEE